MPIMKPCLDCGQLFPKATGHGRCDNCQTAWQQRQDERRGNSSQRGYDHQWRQVRQQVLDRDKHRCQINGHRCTGTATTVDHIKPLAHGGARLEPANLRAACVPCNSGKAATDRRVAGGRKGWAGQPVMPAQTRPGDQDGDGMPTFA